MINITDGPGGFIVPEEIAPALVKLSKKHSIEGQWIEEKKMTYFRVGPKSYVNPTQIVRWQFHLSSRSTELDTKDVYEISVTLWLTDGTSASFHDLKTLVAFNSVVSQEATQYSAEDGTFAYYLGHLVQFERIKEPA